MESALHVDLTSDNAQASNLVYEVGCAKVILEHGGATLQLQQEEALRYCDAQLDDYHVDGVMRWRPPIQMKIRARFSSGQSVLQGTAGFGFWNDPFGMTKITERQSWNGYGRLPQAVWFFYAGLPSNMSFARNVAGHGWKAATLDATELMTKLLLPVAPLAMLSCRVPLGYSLIWPFAQRLLKIDESLLTFDMTEWHDYELQWHRRSTHLSVDGVTVFATPFAPRGPLGFVAWIDNQYMIATPQGRFKSGIVAAGNQWMEISSLKIEAGHETRSRKRNHADTSGK